MKFNRKIADTTQQTIFERDCFRPLACKVKEISAARDHSSVIITGSSGIGKTFFGLQLAHKLIAEGGIVAYNYRNQFRVVFAPTLLQVQSMDQSDKKAFLQSLLTKYQEGKLSDLKCWEETGGDVDSPNFWGLAANKEHEIWKRLLDFKETWLLVDLHRGDKYEDGRQSCKIVLTSTARKGDWPDLDSGGDTVAKKLFMGPLSLSEAKRIAKESHSNLSQEEVENRFEKVGGSARLLFAQPSSAQQKVNEAFKTGTQNLLDPNADNPTLNSAVIHVVADDNFEMAGRKFASPVIAARVVDAVINNRELEEKIWLEATAGQTGTDITGARGVFAERLWHRSVRKKQAIRVKELTPHGEADGTVEEKHISVSFQRTRRFSKSDLSDLTELRVGDFGLPDNGQFPAVDSIAVLESIPWAQPDETGGGVVGIMFQMAIGTSHKLAQGKTLQDIDSAMAEHVETFTAGTSPLYLVYVTESAGSFQSNCLNYTTREKNAYKNLPPDLKRIKQFAISFKKLADAC